MRVLLYSADAIDTDKHINYRSRSIKVSVFLFEVLLM